MILEHLDRNNLHHAYLIEGKREEIIPEILKFIKDIGIETVANPDLYHISIDSFKIEDARNLRSYATEKSFSSSLSAQAGKKIFIISANNFLLEAQNSLLKLFEEPIENTHFFLIVPDVNSLLKTLVSRFYFISLEQNLDEEIKNAERFIAMPLKKRIDFVKELLVESEEEDSEGNEIVILDSTRSRALKFLNALEFVLHKNFFTPSNFLKNSSGLTLPGVPGGTYAVHNSSENCFAHFFKVREFLRMPGSSTKTLMESVALVIPS